MTTENPINPKLAKTKFFRKKIIDNRYTLVEVDLLTGRTHQIRVHLASIGFPIVGDQTYGRSKTNAEILEKYNFSRQWLHAFRLKFCLFDQKYQFEAPLKNDLMKFLSKEKIQEIADLPFEI